MFFINLNCLAFSINLKCKICIFRNIYFLFTETTEAPGTNCAAPHWFGDNFCDDENNTADCGFDGGDCCNNEGPGWDNYCADCECLA